jgi:hypothetical protein
MHGYKKEKIKQNIVKPGPYIYDMIYISSIISDKHYRLKNTLYRACDRCGPDDFKSVI